jgi:hypothetical protein
MVSLRPSLHIHVQSLGRFDEILYLVEKTSALAVPDLRPLPLPVAILTSLAVRCRGIGVRISCSVHALYNHAWIEVCFPGRAK